MLKVAVVILIVMLAYAAVYSLMNLVVPEVMMKSSLEAMTAKPPGDAGEYLKPLTVGQRNVGVHALATTIAGFFVLFAGFRKAQKWAWWSFLVVGGIAWVGGLIISIAIGDTMNMIFLIIGTVLCLVGILLPIKSFFAKAAEA